MIDKLLAYLLDALGGSKNGTPHTCTVPYRSLAAIAILAMLLGTAISSYVPLPTQMAEVRNDVASIKKDVSTVQTEINQLHDVNSKILDALIQGGRRAR